MGNQGCTALYYTSIDNKGYIGNKIYITLWWALRDILKFDGQQDIYSITVHSDG